MNCQGDPDAERTLLVQLQMNFAHTALIALFASATAAAQTPGLGETRPADPAPREETPAVDHKATPLPAQDKSRSDRDLGRCRELTGTARADCLHEDRAASGATRRDEPPSAPPPQNPR
jgi:hypothetical protein